MTITSLSASNVQEKTIKFHSNQNHEEYKKIIETLQTSSKEEIIQSMIADIKSVEKAANATFNDLKNQKFHNKNNLNTFIENASAFIAGIESLYGFHPKLIEFTATEDFSRIKDIYFSHVRSIHQHQKTPIYIKECFNICQSNDIAEQTHKQVSESFGRSTSWANFFAPLLRFKA